MSSQQPNTSPSPVEAQIHQIYEAKKLIQRIHELDDLVRVLNESKLFTRESEAEGPLQEILQHLSQARKKLSLGNLNEAAEEILQGETIINRAVNLKSWWWRWRNVHHLGLSAYHLAWFILLLSLGFNPWTWIVPERIWAVPIEALALGGLGSVLRGFYWLHYKVARRAFRPHYLVSHLLAPLIGILLGMFTYLLVIGGLLTLQAGQAPNVDNAYITWVLCLVAGFKWNWFLTQLGRIFSEDKENKTEDKQDTAATTDPQHSTVDPTQPHGGTHLQEDSRHLNNAGSDPSKDLSPDSGNSAG